MAGVGTRSEPDVVSRIIAEVTGIVDRREEYFRANGIDSIETYRTPAGAGPRRRRVRRRVPGRRRVEHAARRLRRPRAGAPAARHPRPHLRPPHRRRDRRVGRLPGRDARPVRHPARAAARRPDGLRDRPRSSPRWCRRSDPGRGLVPSKLHFLAALPRIDGDAARPRRSATASTTWSGGSREAWTGPAGPKLRLLPERITLDDAAAQAGVPATMRTPRRARTRCSSASTRRSWRRSRSTRTPSRTC